MGLEDLEKELEEEEAEALKEKEKIPVTQDHSCAVKEAEIVENTDILNETNLVTVWSKLMDWFKTNEQQNLYELLKDNIPTIKEKSLNLTLDSGVEKQIVENSQGQIKGFLKRHFTDFENLNLFISESKESKKIILNQKDKFIKLSKKNPWLNTMRQELGLELEM